MTCKEELADIKKYHGAGKKGLIGVQRRDWPLVMEEAGYLGEDETGDPRQESLTS